MPIRILVLHGPNLNLLDGERSLEAIDARLAARAVALGVQVKTFQSNWEGALLDKLAEERNWFDGVIVNPAALAPTSVALAEALALLKRPAMEVLLDAAKPGRSALKSVAQRQIYGKGAQGYLEALDALAPKGAVERAKVQLAKAGQGPGNGAKAQAPEPRAQRTVGRQIASVGPRGPESPPEPKVGKTIGPGEKNRIASSRPQASKTIGSARSSPPPEPQRSGKTIGSARGQAQDDLRAGKSIGPRKVSQGASVDARAKSIGRRTTSGELHIGLTREDVRRKIAERLSGRVSPSGLATWARGQWQELQRGAPCETGQRDQLEDVLQTLLLSTASKASDEQLIDLMTQLG